jgi:sigma-B regulation protein RsbU (phosphoserine phosphatase)
LAAAGGAHLEEQVLAILRDQVGAIILGTIFLFIGLAACGMAALRRRGGVRILVWFGIFSAMYGARILAQAPAGFGILPRSVWASRPYVIAIITYLINIPALLFWLELSLGRLRRFVQIMILAASVIGMAGVCSALITQSPYGFMPFNNVWAICWLLALAVLILVPRLRKRFLAVQSRILAVGTLVLATAALYNNLGHLLNLPDLPALEPLAFAVFTVSLGYVAAEKVFADERRLLSIENELAIAREIQNSILPTTVPELKDARIAAAYHPMTAVAGDFYEFIPVDQNRAGILVADVSGHGVPAALIASMIKVAMQSVVSQANDPAEVLRGLNRNLAGQLRGQFVTAAYLWLDTEIRKALYSAAGHPPLLRWRDGVLERFESNGLLIGVTPDSDYPVCALPLNSGDRFLLYTDGVTDPENVAGDAFGDGKLEQVIRNNQSRPPGELSDQLLSEIRRWQPASTTQQDDITLIVIDVLQ